MNRRTFRLAALALGAATALTACSSSGSHVAAVRPTSTPSATATPSPTATAAPRAVSPLTGLPQGLGRPVLAVKIDNTMASHPQVGVDKADVVYLEEVEAGLTRLLAIFSTAVPPVVGPVRSARESDLPLLAEYGKVALAFSGANRGVLRVVHAANVLDASADVNGSAYYRQSGRHAPYNLFAHAPQLLAAHPAAVKAHDIGLRFGPKPGAGAVPAHLLDLRFLRAHVVWTYSGSRHQWLLAMDGRPTGLGADNVIVQFVQVHQGHFADVNGANSPYSVTVGSGRAWLYREGTLVKGSWRRPSARAGTTFLDASGAPAPLRPGHTWILLVRQGMGVTTR